MMSVTSADPFKVISRNLRKPLELKYFSAKYRPPVFVARSKRFTTAFKISTVSFNDRSAASEECVSLLHFIVDKPFLLTPHIWSITFKSDLFKAGIHYLRDVTRSNCVNISNSESWGGSLKYICFCLVVLDQSNRNNLVSEHQENRKKKHVLSGWQACGVRVQALGCDSSASHQITVTSPHRFNATKATQHPWNFMASFRGTGVTRLKGLKCRIASQSATNKVPSMT